MTAAANRVQISGIIEEHNFALCVFLLPNPMLFYPSLGYTCEQTILWFIIGNWMLRIALY
jgi:hypothetical protein